MQQYLEQVHLFGQIKSPDPDINTLQMANFNQILNHILGMVFIILVFSLAYAYLKPHQLHKRRLVSTLLLKITYLFYLIVLLIIIYLSALVRGGLEEVFYGVEFFVFLVVLFVPTIGIFARKLASSAKKEKGIIIFFQSLIYYLSL